MQLSSWAFQRFNSNHVVKNNISLLLIFLIIMQINSGDHDIRISEWLMIFASERKTLAVFLPP